jgi:glycyl-tRNA synthetase (class II)
MRRILLALLICLLPLQSFAGLVMNAKMAMSNTDAAQAPCHEASQPMAAESHDCCDLQGVCQALCHIVIAPVTAATAFDLRTHSYLPRSLPTAFQSASPRAGFKPPLL